MWTRWVERSLLAMLLGRLGQALELNVDDTDNVKSVAQKVAFDMMSYYTGNRTGDVPGNLPQPYYWWEAGAMFGTMIEYWYYTGDDTYNDVTTQAMLFQVGPENDYMTPNQTKTTGNDDQGFWGMAAMSAAEVKFPNPPANKPQWLALAQAVFNSQALRWDTEYCGGGLRWQVFTFNTGYNYKNTISNGVFFNIASRLAVYTNNETYAEWANKVYDWQSHTGLMTSEYHFYDGAHTDFNCTDINKVQWTYNAGVFLHGAAAMYNHTNGDPLWKTRILGILKATDIFFVNNVMTEVACEGPKTCNTDNYSFKAYFSRWLAASIKLAPFVYDIVMPQIRASAVAAAQQCSGGANGRMCGMRWIDGPRFDGTQGVGQQMGALSIIQANLIVKSEAPVTDSSGGISKGDPSAGTGGTSSQNPALRQSEIKGRDRVGAGFLTGLVIVSLCGGAWWMIA